MINCLVYFRRKLNLKINLCKIFLEQFCFLLNLNGIVMTPGWRIRAASGSSSSELGFLKFQSNVCLYFGCINKKYAQNYVLWIWQIEFPGFLDSYWQKQSYSSLELGPICTAQPASSAAALFVVSALPCHTTERHLHPPSLPASQAEEDQGTTCICSCPSSSTESEDFSHSVTAIVRGLQLMFPRTVWLNWHLLAGRRKG